MTYTVLEVKPDKVIYEIKTEMFMPNVPKMAPTTTKMEYAFVEAPPKAPEGAPKAEVKTTKETVEVGGKKYDCTVAEMKGPTGTIKTWTCPDVPFTGVVKQESGGKVTMQLVEFGKK